MPDRTHHRGGHLGHRAAQGFVGERQQVLDTAATPGEDDHVDVRIGVQLGKMPQNAGDSGRSLNRRVADLETHCGPTTLRNRDNVALRCAGAAGDQSDGSGQERERTFASRVEQALSGEELS